MRILTYVDFADRILKSNALGHFSNDLSPREATPGHNCFSFSPANAQR